MLKWGGIRPLSIFVYVLSYIFCWEYFCFLFFYQWVPLEPASIMGYLIWWTPQNIMDHLIATLCGCGWWIGVFASYIVTQKSKTIRCLRCDIITGCVDKTVSNTQMRLCFFCCLLNHSMTLCIWDFINAVISILLWLTTNESYL